jgi:hypothetical protein
MSESSNQCASPGYLRGVSTQFHPDNDQNAAHNAGTNAFYKELPPGFEWFNIPKLSVITGINGVGKTRLLHSILTDYPDEYSRIRYQPQIRLEFESEPTGFSCFYQSSYDPESFPPLQKNTHKSNGKDVQTNLLDTREFLIHLMKDEQYYLEIQLLKTYLEENRFVCVLLGETKIELSKKYLEENGFEYIPFELLNKYLKKEGLGCILFDKTKIELLNKYLEKNGFKYKSFDKTKIGSLYKYLESGFEYISFDKTKLELLNKYLKENGFEYILSDKAQFTRSDSDSDVSGNDRVSFDQASLTPGEQAHLFNLLINYEISNSSERKNKFHNALLLLDEPDAHLHPSLIPTLIDTVTKLVTFYGMQVIMTTHKPTTVTLIKEKECLFHMKIDPATKNLTIEPVLKRNHSIQLLTSNIIAVNGNLRLVFVEAKDDKQFYEIVNERLIKQNQYFTDVQQLVFVCFGNNAKDSCRSAVENLVQKLTHYGDNNLQDFVYGLIDNDNIGEQKNTEQKNVIALERYSIENYIYDPINVFFYCFNDKRVKIPTEISECWKQLRKDYEPHLTVQPSHIREILEHQVLTCLQKQKIFQAIVDCVSMLFMSKLQEIINQIKDNKDNQKSSDKNNEYIYDHLLDLGNEKAHKLVSYVNNQITLSDEKANVIIPINNEQTITLQYNVVLVLMKGHFLVNIYQKINREFNWKHLFEFDKSFVKTQDIIIPQDLLLRFTYLHSSAPENHPAHRDLQKMVSKNTNNRTTVNPNQSTIESNHQSASIAAITTATDVSNLLDTTTSNIIEVRFIHYFNYLHI